MRVLCDRPPLRQTLIKAGERRKLVPLLPAASHV
jgi:hypothetical protein